MAAYKSRAHQIRAFEREVHNGKTSLRRALRAAAMIGAAEERGRILELVKREDINEPQSMISLPYRLRKDICAVSVLQVLGFETAAEAAGGKNEKQT